MNKETNEAPDLPPTPLDGFLEGEAIAAAQRCIGNTKPMSRDEINGLSQAISLKRIADATTQPIITSQAVPRFKPPAGESDLRRQMRNAVEDLIGLDPLAAQAVVENLLDILEQGDIPEPQLTDGCLVGPTFVRAQFKRAIQSIRRGV